MKSKVECNCLNFTPTDAKTRGPHHKLGCKQFRLPVAKCRRLHCKQFVTDEKETICNKCITRDKAKKRRILRNQRTIGIKQVRKRKPVVKWKTKLETNYKFTPTKVVYLKKEGNVTFVKYSSSEKWRSISKKRYQTLVREQRSIIWNPEESGNKIT